MTNNYVPYRIKAHNIETCNCNHGCGCQFGGFPDNKACEGIIGYEVIEGFYGDVDLKGVRAVTAVKWPGAIHEGHGTMALFVDDKAGDSQADALANVFSGRSGGMPWEALGATFDSVQGPVRKSIEMIADGERSRFTIPGLLDVQMTPLIDPVSGQEKEVHIVFPRGGLIWNEGHVATTTAMSIKHDSLDYAYPGRYACYATVEWTNQK